MMNSPSRMLFEAMGRSIPGSAAALPPSFYRMAADYCYVDDCCDAILKVVEATELTHSCYNIGGGTGTTEEHVRKAVARACGRNASKPVRDASWNYFDITRICAELGYYAAAHWEGRELKSDLHYGSHERHRVDVYRSGKEMSPVVPFVQGGGFVGGDKASDGQFYGNVGRTSLITAIRASQLHTDWLRIMDGLQAARTLWRQ